MPMEMREILELSDKDFKVPMKKKLKQALVGVLKINEKEKKENISIETEDIKKNQIEILKLKII